jgi:hypothetical protein
MEQRNFYEAKSHLYEFYGIDMDDDAFETIGLHAWDKINNKDYRFYTYIGKVSNFRLDLPCNVDVIEYVQGAGESVGTTAPYSDMNAYNSSSIIEETIENYKGTASPYYGRGHYLEYTQSGNTLIFKRDNFQVKILYKGILVDDEGLPKLNFKEIEAIAIYCAYIDNQRKAMVTKDKSTFEIAQMLKQDWIRACANARTPIYLTQNAMDAILDVQSSWDRKRFGISLKAIR